MTARAQLRASTAMAVNAPPPACLPDAYAQTMVAVAKEALGRDPVILFHPRAPGVIFIEGMSHMPVEAWYAAGQVGAGHA